MFATIFYIIGIILGIKAVIEILNEPITTTGKIITIVFVLLLSWVGIALYYLVLKGNLYKWFR
ncbi:MAG: hypothetical protein ACI358_09725 [Candidatus Limimorpha sp.]